MENNLNMTDVVAEVKNANEDELRAVIEKWFEATRTQGLKLGASYISAAIMGAMQKHLHKESKVTLRDYRRCIDDISKIIAVPLKKQEEVKEEVVTDVVDKPVAEPMEEVVEVKETINE